jgi:hypothetical protein
MVVRGRGRGVQVAYCTPVNRTQQRHDRFSTLISRVGFPINNTQPALHGPDTAEVRTLPWGLVGAKKTQFHRCYNKKAVNCSQKSCDKLNYKFDESGEKLFNDSLWILIVLISDELEVMYQVCRADS